MIHKHTYFKLEWHIRKDILTNHILELVLICAVSGIVLSKMDNFKLVCSTKNIEANTGMTSIF